MAAEVPRARWRRSTRHRRPASKRCPPARTTAQPSATSRHHILFNDTSFDYVQARDFIDGYADRAPDEIADSVQRLRDIFDTFASAAEKAGLKPNDVPLPDQADEVMSALTYSEDEQADNGRAFQTVDAWVTNGCES